MIIKKITPFTGQITKSSKNHFTKKASPQAGRLL